MSHLKICLLALLALPLSLQAQEIIGRGGTGSVSGSSVTAVFQDGPSALDLQLLDQLLERKAKIKKHGLPQTPIGLGAALPANFEPATEGPSAAHTQAGGSPGDLQTFFNVAPNTNALMSSTGEPSFAQNGDNMFMTGNFYASRSTNGGSSWSFISPFTTFPASDGGFCCDQEAIYDPVNDMYIWLLQYWQDGTDNRYRIAVSVGSAEFAAGTWTYWDFLPTDIGLTTNRWFDYPHISITDDEFTFTANVFDTRNCQIVTCLFNASVLTIPLADMADKGSVAYKYWNAPNGGTMTPVQGDTDTVYWGQHRSTTSFRLHKWDGINVIQNDVTHSTYANSGYSCVAPDGNDPCGFEDDRVLTAWTSMGIVAFAWNAAQDANRPWPYTKVIRIKESDNTLFDEREMGFSNAAVVFPSAAVNSRGHVGGTFGYMGGNIQTATCVWASDNYNGGHVSQYQMVSNFTKDYICPTFGTNAPASNRFGDYFKARIHSPNGLTWVGSGGVMTGGTGNANYNPRLMHFGRAEDVDGENFLDADLYASLSGPYISGGSSSTAINDIIPLVHPYKVFPWSHDRDDFVFFMPPDIVDWVLVRASTSSGVLQSTTAALMRANGEIVGTNGAKLIPLSGTGSDFSPSHLSVEHRTHLGVVTPNPASLYSFRFSDAFGPNSQQDSGDGYNLMWGGDGTGNRSVTTFDFTNIWLPRNGANATYEAADFNMDKTITAFDFLNIWLPANGRALQTPW